MNDVIHKSRKLFLYIISYLFLFHLVVFSTDLKEFDAEIILSHEKKKYIEYEPIWIHYKILNYGEIGPRLNPLEQIEKFEIYDEQGKKYNTHWLSSVVRNKIDPLKAGEKFEDDINILINYGESIFVGGSPLYLPNGIYKIKYRWKEQGFKELLSNEIGILVEEAPPEEQESQDNYIKSLKAFFKKDTKQGNNNVNRLIEKFPNSKYTRQAITFMIYYNSLNDDDKSLKTAMRASKQLLEDYPDRRYQNRAIRSIKKYYKENNDLKGMKVYFEDLSQKITDLNCKNRILKEIDSIKNK